MYKLDFHTHSVMSPDGGITEKEYTEIIAKKTLDYIAITDHNRIDFAQKLHEKLGECIIVGEEISTTAGDVIGLFLSVKVSPHQSIAKTIQSIHAQGGLVYVPHPFDTFRKGIGEMGLLENLSEIDIIEGFNARVILSWQNTEAEKFSQRYNVSMGIGSDAHSRQGIDKTYVIIEKPFTKNAALPVLQHAQYNKKYQLWTAYFSPKLNKLKKKFSIRNNE